jgi:hypothetical protein
MKKKIDPITAWLRDLARRCATKFDKVEDCDEKYTIFVQWWLHWWLNEAEIALPRRVELEGVHQLFTGAKPIRNKWTKAAEEMERLKDESERQAEALRGQSAPLLEILAQEMESGLLAVAAAALRGEGQVFAAERAYHGKKGKSDEEKATQRVVDDFAEAIAEVMIRLVSARVAYEDIHDRAWLNFTGEDVLLIVQESFLSVAKGEKRLSV